MASKPGPLFCGTLYHVRVQPQDGRWIRKIHDRFGRTDLRWRTYGTRRPNCYRMLRKIDWRQRPGRHLAAPAILRTLIALAYGTSTVTSDRHHYRRAPVRPPRIILAVGQRYAEGSVSFRGLPNCTGAAGRQLHCCLPEACRSPAGRPARVLLGPLRSDRQGVALRIASVPRTAREALKKILQAGRGARMDSIGRSLAIRRCVGDF